MMFGLLKRTITEDCAAEWFVRGLLSDVERAFPEALEILEELLEGWRIDGSSCKPKVLVASHLFSLEMIVLADLLPEDQVKALRRRCIQTFAVRTDRNVEEVLLEVAAYQRLYNAHRNKPAEARQVLTRLFCQKLGVQCGPQSAPTSFRDLGIVLALHFLFVRLSGRWKRLRKRARVVPAAPLRTNVPK
jgi:hypothetical protein